MGLGEGEVGGMVLLASAEWGFNVGGCASY